MGYFGAVRLRDGRFLFRREPECFNALTCHAFLRQLAQASAGTGRRVVVISDNAKYHHAKLHRAWREQRAERFALDFLPPYSPDLNPIERVWKLVRRMRLHNRYFATLDDVVITVERGGPGCSDRISFSISGLICRLVEHCEAFCLNS